MDDQAPVHGSPLQQAVIRTFASPELVAEALKEARPDQVFLPAAWITHLPAWRALLADSSFVVYLAADQGPEVRAAFLAGADDVHLLDEPENQRRETDTVSPHFDDLFPVLDALMPLAPFIYNPDSRELEFMGRQIADILDFDPEAIPRTETDWWHLLESLDVSGEVRNWLGSIRASGREIESHSRILRMQDQKGEVRWLKILLRVVPPRGSLLSPRIVGFVQDFTDQQAQLSHEASAKGIMDKILHDLDLVIFRLVISGTYPVSRIRFSFFSGDGAKLWGVDPDLWPEEVDLETWGQVMMQDKAAELLDVFNQKLRVGQTVSFAYPYRHPNGHIRWIHNQLVPHRLPNGEIEVLGMARDISREVQQKQDLGISQQALSEIENGVAILMPQEDTHALTMVNDAFVRLCDRRAEDMPDVEAWLACYSASDQQDLAQVRDALAHRQPLKIVLKSQSHTGQFWHEVKLAPIRPETAERGWVLVLHDVSAYVEALEELQLTRDRKRYVLSSLPDGIAVLDADGYISTINDAWEEQSRFWGEEGASPGAHYLTVCQHMSGPLWSYGDQVARGLSEMMSGRRAQFEAEVFLSHAPLPAWYIIRMVRMRQEEGGYVIARINITSQKLAEKALIESEQRYRWLAESIEDLIVLLDSEGKIQYTNPAVELLLGMKSTDVLGKTAQDFILGEDVPLLYEDFKEARQSGRPFRRVFRARHAEGHVLWLESLSRILPHYGGGGQDYILSVVRDVTQSREVESRIRFQSQALEQARNAIVVTDMAFAVTFMNRAAEELYEVSAEEALGSYLPEVYQVEWENEEQREASIKQVQSQGYWHGQVFQRKRSGDRFFADAAITLLSDVDSRPQGYLGVIMDISILKEAEDALHNLNSQLEALVKTRTRELEAANRELEAFNFTISHDLRSPLRGIHGFAQILHHRYAKELGADGKEFLDFILRDVKKMDHLIRDLLTFSQVGRYRLRRQVVHMDRMIQEVWEEVMLAPYARGHQLKSASLPPLVSDSHLIRVIFTNLISNAVKYSSHVPEPWVTIGGHQTAGRVVLFVRDNGIGFDMAQHDRIFRVFQRLHTEEEYEGTGAGLSIVQRIVERMEGRVWAESTLGKGATFFVELPDMEVPESAAT